jgi:acetyl-CoA C-acetyltransferase
MDITVLGTGMTTFGELWSSSPRSLVREAVSQALLDADRKIADIDCLVVGNMLSGLLGNQQHAGALFAEELGLQKAAFTIEGACASGGLAVHSAVMGILSGLYDTVLVVGIEKMTDHKPELVSTSLMAAGANDERLAGSTFPGTYAMLARVYMDRYGVTEEELASIAVKNHYHGSLNPKAQFRSPITVEAVMKSSYVADPLKLLDCSPITDGAAAVVLSRSNAQETRNRKQVHIIASSVSNDSLGIANRSDCTSLQATVRAAKTAYSQADIHPHDIDVAEVHDCFTIAEIFALEDLGIYQPGTAGKRIAAGDATLGTHQGVTVNTSGGLKACGHPVGATGVKQIVEIADQLRGRCGARQVERHAIGITQNVGGSGATSVVHILKQG